MFSAEVLNEITGVARQHNIEAAALEAIADVESAGIAFWNVEGKRLPPVRPEAHYFYRLLSGSKRAQAVQQGLANPRAGAVKVPTNYTAVYARVQRMMALDMDAAIMSCSWGLGQVMGENWKKLGYASPTELMQSCNTVAGQVELMDRFIETNGLVPYLKRHDWAGFAKRYNGSGYRANGYDRKMAQAYNRYVKYGGPVLAPSPAARAQMPDPAVKEVQKKLNTVGYTTPTDGKLTPVTVSKVKEFQEDQGLVPDGTVGVNTRDALDTQVSVTNKASGDKYVGTGLATGGIDAAIDKLNDSTSSLQWLGTGNDYVSYILLALTCVTVGLILFGLYKKFKD